MENTHSPFVSFEKAIQLLEEGEICAFGTETVYGLGARADRNEAVIKIYEAKSRPRFNPLIAHCADLDMVQSVSEIDANIERLFQFWPGALTLVLPLKAGAPICNLVTAGLETVAVRIPGKETARALIANVGVPIAAPSANPSGRISPTSAQMVVEQMGDKVPVFDNGAAEAGVESTILSVSAGKIIQLRAGAIARAEIEKVIGKQVQSPIDGHAVSAPGMLKSHYAPNAKLRLNVTKAEKDEALLGFGEKSDESELNLSPRGDLKEAAKNLFAYLADLDQRFDAIAVAPIPHHGLGEAINDRLQRAAAK